jgi:hypothetical protein
MSAPTRNPRIKIHTSGIATLSGLNYSDLRSILTAASLWRYQESKREHSDGDETQTVQRAEYERTHRAIIDMAHASMDAAIRATHAWSREPPTKEQRFATVRESRRVRLAIKDALTALRARRATAKP